MKLKKRDNPYLDSGVPYELYLNATVRCSECDTEQKVILGKEMKVWHECNKGNRVIELPDNLYLAIKKALT